MNQLLKPFLSWLTYGCQSSMEAVERSLDLIGYDLADLKWTDPDATPIWFLMPRESSPFYKAPVKADPKDVFGYNRVLAPDPRWVVPNRAQFAKDLNHKMQQVKSLKFAEHNAATQRAVPAAVVSSPADLKGTPHLDSEILNWIDDFKMNTWDLGTPGSKVEVNNYVEATFRQAAFKARTCGTGQHTPSVEPVAGDEALVDWIELARPHIVTARWDSITGGPSITIVTQELGAFMGKTIREALTQAVNALPRAVQ